jgi:hypothetical protein
MKNQPGPAIRRVGLAFDQSHFLQTVKKPPQRGLFHLDAFGDGRLGEAALPVNLGHNARLRRADAKPAATQTPRPAPLKQTEDIVQAPGELPDPVGLLIWIFELSTQ